MCEPAFVSGFVCGAAGSPGLVLTHTTLTKYEIAPSASVRGAGATRCTDYSLAVVAILAEMSEI